MGKIVLDFKVKFSLELPKMLNIASSLSLHEFSFKISCVYVGVYAGRIKKTEKRKNRLKGSRMEVIELFDVNVY